VLRIPRGGQEAAKREAKKSSSSELTAISEGSRILDPPEKGGLGCRIRPVRGFDPTIKVETGCDAGRGPKLFDNLVDPSGIFNVNGLNTPVGFPCGTAAAGAMV
jgi:hypothetical protein